MLKVLTQAYEFVRHWASLSTSHMIHQHGRRDSKRIHFAYLMLFQKL
jgi:hypothetical protein